MISDQLDKTLQRAKDFAEKLNHEYMTIEHLLFAMIDDNDAKDVFEACNVDTSSLKKELEIFLKEKLTDLINTEVNEVKPTVGFQRVIQRAVIHVQSSGKDEASSANVLVSIFSERESHAVYFLQKEKLTRLDVIDYISHGLKKDDDFDLSERKLRDENFDDNSNNELSFIEKYTQNLNKKASLGKIDPIIGRNNEIMRAVHILSRRNKNNPIFVGEPGVGKTALAEGLALKIINKEVPKSLNDSTIYSLDLGVFLQEPGLEEILKKD